MKREDAMVDAEELNELEKTSLASLRRDAAPPPALESSVVGELRSRGLVRAGGSRATWIRLGALAAGIALFLAGVVVGGRSARPGAPPSPRYLLLLEGADTVSPEEETARVSEYSAWARKEAGAGHLLSGEKLQPDARVLGTGPSSGSASVRGFFVISAKDDAEALSIANDCPHLRHGGRVVLRRIGHS
jgi:hypothetical protein